VAPDHRRRRGLSLCAAPRPSISRQLRRRSRKSSLAILLLLDGRPCPFARRRKRTYYAYTTAAGGGINKFEILIGPRNQSVACAVAAWCSERRSEKKLITRSGDGLKILLIFYNMIWIHFFGFLILCVETIGSNEKDATIIIII